MNALKHAFALLQDFSTAKAVEQRRRLLKVDRLLKQAEAKCPQALIALRERDQLRKQHAYMLIASGHVDDGVRESSAIAADYEKEIINLHDEAAFQLSEAALASFRARRPGLGKALALSALWHAGRASRLSHTLVAALAFAQKQQARNTKSKGERSVKCFGPSLHPGPRPPGKRRRWLQRVRSR